ncbi:MAG TPA: hypothetical protein VGJ67_07405 [Actinomycetota bacterium]
MLELVPTRVCVISCLASDEALVELHPPEGAYLCWVADDELMLVGKAEVSDELQRLAGEAVTGDDDAVVLDVSDGWSAWTLSGAGTDDVLERLSELKHSGDGYLQGDVAHVPARLIAHAERLHLLVPAMWEEHLRSRIHNAAAGLDLRVSPEADWSLA